MKCKSIDVRKRRLNGLKIQACACESAWRSTFNKSPKAFKTLTAEQNLSFQAIQTNGLQVFV